MKIFYLPDLGEGLHEAEIREWLVKEGDQVTEDQPIVAMETAKALLDVPSPFTGTITKLHGNTGDLIKTGAPLVSFNADAQSSHHVEQHRKDAGTVVGSIQVGDTVINESATGIKPAAAQGVRIKASPVVRKLANELGVDLNSVSPTGPAGSITSADVSAAAKGNNTVVNQTSQTTADIAAPAGYTALHGVTRSMAINMALAQQQVAPVTLVDDADIHHFGPDVDISVRIMRAVQHACEQVPKLNAHFHGKSLSYKQIKEINLAVAVDTEAGLYAPVIKDVANKSDLEIREKINEFKVHAKKQDFPPADLHGATISLSNFGVFIGRYASPIIVPPTVAIIGIGKLREAVVVENGAAAVHKILPISITVDHRLITGGEAARFLAALINSLQT